LEVYFQIVKKGVLMSTKHTNNWSAFFNLILLIALSSTLTGCGGNTSDAQAPTPLTNLLPTIKLTIAQVSPESGGGMTVMHEGENAAITVNVQPYQSLNWTWEVSGTSKGTLNDTQGENIVYTAGTAGIDTITARATMTDGTEIKQSVSINVEPPATEIPPATDTPLPPKVTLDTLQDNQKVPCSNLVSGTYPDGLERAIWPIVYVGGVYHPQDEGGKAAQKANGKWIQTVRFGDCVNTPNKDVGTAFQLIIVTANDSANAAFEAYITNGKRTGQWPGMPELPSGADPQVRVIVIRE